MAAAAASTAEASTAEASSAAATAAESAAASDTGAPDTAQLIAAIPQVADSDAVLEQEMTRAAAAVAADNMASHPCNSIRRPSPTVAGGAALFVVIPEKELYCMFLRDDPGARPAAIAWQSCL